MKKRMISLLVIALIGLLGCQKTIKEPLHLQIFYLTGCPDCQVLEENLLAKVKAKYDETITVVYYDIEKPETLTLLESVTEQLDGFDWSLDELTVPFIVLDGYFATLAYTPYLDQTYLKMFDAIVQNRSFSEFLPEESWLFKTIKETE